ncbi:hypothetical protein CYMTET_8273, partial [Cymbomonas tetramitiformis]
MHQRAAFRQSAVAVFSALPLRRNSARCIGPKHLKRQRKRTLLQQQITCEQNSGTSASTSVDPVSESVAQRIKRVREAAKKLAQERLQAQVEETNGAEAEEEDEQQTEAADGEVDGEIVQPAAASGSIIETETEEAASEPADSLAEQAAETFETVDAEEEAFESGVSRTEQLVEAVETAEEGEEEEQQEGEGAEQASLEVEALAEQTVETGELAVEAEEEQVGEETEEDETEEASAEVEGSAEQTVEAVQSAEEEELEEQPGRRRGAGGASREEAEEEEAEEEETEEASAEVEGSAEQTVEAVQSAEEEELEEQVGEETEEDETEEASAEVEGSAEQTVEAVQSAEEEGLEEQVEEEEEETEETSAEVEGSAEQTVEAVQSAGQEGLEEQVEEAAEEEEEIEEASAEVEEETSAEVEGSAEQTAEAGEQAGEGEEEEVEAVGNVDVVTGVIGAAEMERLIRAKLKERTPAPANPWGDQYYMAEALMDGEKAEPDLEAEAEAAADPDTFQLPEVPFVPGMKDPDIEDELTSILEATELVVPAEGAEELEGSEVKPSEGKEEEQEDAVAEAVEEAFDPVLAEMLEQERLLREQLQLMEAEVAQTAQELAIAELELVAMDDEEELAVTDGEEELAATDGEEEDALPPLQSAGALTPPEPPAAPPEEVTVDAVAPAELESHPIEVWDPWGEEALALLRSQNNEVAVTAPAQVRAGSIAHIYFHQERSKLASTNSVILVGGCNEWQTNHVEKILAQASLAEFEGWWHTSFDVPDEEYIYQVDFVFTDGEGHYDNNACSDYKILVEGAPTKEEFEEFQRMEDLRREAALEVLKQEEIIQRQREEEERKRLAQEKKKVEKFSVQFEARHKEAGKVQAIAKHGLPGVWWTEPEVLTSGGSATLYYQTGPHHLHGARAANVVMSADNWTWKRDMGGDMVPTQAQELWAYEFEVPTGCCVLSFVFKDSTNRYDNNKGTDFHVLVDAHLTNEQRVGAAYKVHLSQQSIREEELRKSRAEREAFRAEVKAVAHKAFYSSNSKLFYTQPAEPQAGETFTLFYNPEVSPLKGAGELAVSGGFNRWQHETKIDSVPLRSVGDGSGLYAVELTSPPDAHLLDFVVSLSHHGKQKWDNNSKLDYHVPLAGAVGPKPLLHVVHVAVEMAPVAKVGGLGDVVTALGRAVQDEGHRIEVVLPKYNVLNYDLVQDLELGAEMTLGGERVLVYEGKVEGLDVKLLEPVSGIFDVGCIYGRGDDHIRFHKFCTMACDWIKVSGRTPEVIHCHDWSTAPVTWQDNRDARCVFTIHNL